MNGLLRRALLTSALVSLSAVGVLAEDLTIVSSVSGGKAPTTTTTYFTATKTRTQSEERDTIVDYSTGSMVVIDHRKKEYYQTSFDEMAAMLRHIEAQVAQMPAFLQKTMGGGVGAITVTPGAVPRKIAGYECTQYTLAMGTDMTFEIWAAPSLAVPPSYVDALKAPYASLGPGGRKFVAMFDEMKKIKGFPLGFGMRYKLVGQKVDTLSEATEVRKGPIPASTFSVPASYRQKDSPFKQK